MRPGDEDGGLGLPLGGEAQPGIGHGNLLHSLLHAAMQAGDWVDPPQRMAGLGPTSFGAALCATASMTRLFSKSTTKTGQTHGLILGHWLLWQPPATKLD